METIDKMDTEILQLLKNTKRKKMSTYTIAKDTGISWSTVNIHCYSLAGSGKLRFKLLKDKLTSRTKRVWWLTK